MAPNRETNHQSLCTAIPTKPKIQFSTIYDTSEYREKAAMRLSGAIKIPTMTFDDMGPPSEDERWASFAKMHQYLQDTYPIVHEQMERIVVGGYSLIYILEGLQPELKPLMLTAHIDVVPAVTSLDRWTYPPFEGIIDGEWIYGRGASDCKNTVMGSLSAVEHLLEEGWKPQRTIILAFGQDEEISGSVGAPSIAKLLEDRFGRDGVAMLVDEGGMGLDSIYGTEFALPGIAEGGHTNVEITVEMAGGHSSIPPRHTSIGILSKIISSVEDSDIFRPHLTTESPMWGWLSCVGEYGNENQVPSWIIDVVSSPSPDFDGAANKIAAMSPSNRYLVQTSKAATVVHGGLKVNALPESATVNFNTRIEVLNSLAEVAQAYLSLVKPLAEKYSLHLNNESYSEKPSIGNITVELKSTFEPSPITPTGLHNVAWEVFSRAIQASFGQDVITTPSAMTGNGDTRYYENLTRNIYRWDPLRVGTSLNIHTVDEKIKIESHIETIRFYTELALIADQTRTESF